MTTTHDYHRLSLCGFKGLDRIARERRHQRNLERLGFWLTVLFLILGVIASWPAGASCPPGFTLMIEVVYDGHPSIEFVPNFRTKAACEAAGKMDMGQLEGAVKYLCVQQ